MNRTKFAVVLATTMLTSPAWSQALPTGGQVVSGQASISQSGQTMTINQSTDKMIANWQSFSIGAGNSVIFNQPGASSVALNRVVGQDPSQILGSLSANGHVFLINPNGIAIGKTGTVQTGGFVASTLGISNENFLANNYRFTGNGGSITNEGSISGNVVALIAPTVSNAGTITGSTALAAGTDALLDFNGDGLLSVEVKASTVKTLVENKGLIRADGGVAILTAKGASDAMKGVVNNTGTVQAASIGRKNGRILLLGDMKHGEVNAGGTLRARSVETSAAKVNLAKDLKVDTQGGRWLIDPIDITIDANYAATLQAALSTGDVTVSTAGSGSDQGNIAVNAPIFWGSHILTLRADNNIAINASLTSTGMTGLDGLILQYAQTTATGTYTVNAPVNLAAGSLFQTQNGIAAPITYTVITDLNALQNINTNLSGNYVLGANIDATSTVTWNSGAGFTPIGASFIDLFSGTFDGLGHTISDLHINRPGAGLVGLFGAMGGSAAIRNVSLADASITGGERTGALVGLNWGGVISNSYADADVNGGPTVGVLVGSNIGVIKGSHADGNVSGSNTVGGLAGSNTGLIEDSYADSDVSGTSDVGGLVGALGGTIRNSHAAGNVSGLSRIGGLVGGSSLATIETSHASGNVTDTDGNFSFAGGLVGRSSQSTIRNSYATGNVQGNGGAYVGGLVGVNSFATIEQAYATGTVSGNDWVGGLVGENDAGTIVKSYATGDVQGHGVVGGLVGDNIFGGTIRNSYATGNVVASVADVVGGLVGRNYATVENSFWDTDTTNQLNACGTSSSNTCGAAGLTTTQALTQASYGAFDFLNDWFMVDGYTRPFGRWEYSSTITNSHQLQLMAMDLGANYVLANDIDFGTVFTDGNRSDMWATTQVSGASARGFVPIGGGSFDFAGTFDGHGHTIANLVIDRPDMQSSDDHIGLFGWVGVGGMVRNVGLQGGSVHGNNHVGALVGMLSGTVENSFASTNVEGSASVGGLVGTISTGTVRNSYATGNVSGTHEIGGLVGTNQSSGTIATSYATGTVGGTTNTGGLVGWNAGTVTAGFYSLSGTGQSDAGKGTGLTAGEMNDPFTFINAGFDFATVWGTSVGGANNGMPVLRAFGDAVYDAYVNVAGSAHTTYGTLASFGGLTVTGVNVNHVTLGWGSAVPTTLGVGTYNLSDPNVLNLTNSGGALYVGSVAGGLTIDKAPLTVTANNALKIYDGVPFSGSNGVTYSGFMNGEGAGVLSGTLAYGGTAQGARDPGSYSITASGLSSSNYEISYIGGRLVVASPRDAGACSLNGAGGGSAVCGTVAPDPALALGHNSTVEIDLVLPVSSPGQNAGSILFGSTSCVTGGSDGSGPCRTAGKQR